MRRLLQLGTLLQFGTLLLLAAAILVPISESFDRWDAPGLGNDTEFHLFAIVLFLALVLLICRHVAAATRLFLSIFFLRLALPSDRRLQCLRNLTQAIFLVPPFASPPTPALTPLRI